MINRVNCRVGRVHQHINTVTFQTADRLFVLPSEEDYNPHNYCKVADNKRTTFIRVQEHFTAE
ncbi:hypothetical protein M5216_000305 [Vibrio vulnificus]|uniref:hypothetical protein n=1 Tax=Vibrio vulnificus TaxID=672 RepID=UPI0011812A55|nr:hypothetical protein [Vibrio vulnificus]EJE8733693.1 hypothetical protein [Vibrio vulnificus]EJO3992644.1 hypothetical protein [Vibrio vulnificus]EKA7349204.1 hypothetical protein [Vibrio vulnificus]ELP5900298.1 hypothetical protein [Vibrio vulnificus]MCU8219877.1 hypothetical protein [Vibrio vulnificus]